MASPACVSYRKSSWSITSIIGHTMVLRFRAMRSEGAKRCPLRRPDGRAATCMTLLCNLFTLLTCFLGDFSEHSSLRIREEASAQALSKMDQGSQPILPSTRGPWASYMNDISASAFSSVKRGEEGLVAGVLDTVMLEGVEHRCLSCSALLWKEINFLLGGSLFWPSPFRVLNLTCGSAASTPALAPHGRLPVPEAPQHLVAAIREQTVLARESSSRFPTVRTTEEGSDYPMSSSGLEVCKQGLVDLCPAGMLQAR